MITIEPSREQRVLALLEEARNQHLQLDSVQDFSQLQEMIVDLLAKESLTSAVNIGQMRGALFAMHDQMNSGLHKAALESLLERSKDAAAQLLKVKIEAVEALSSEICTSLKAPFRPHIEGVTAVVVERMKRGEL